MCRYAGMCTRSQFTTVPITPLVCSPNAVLVGYVCVPYPARVNAPVNTVYMHTGIGDTLPVTAHYNSLSQGYVSRKRSAITSRCISS